MKIEVWSDYICPYCYKGKKTMELALNEFEHRDQVEIIYRSYVLSPDASHEKLELVNDMLVKKYQMTYDEVIDENARLTKQAAKLGLEYLNLNNELNFKEDDYDWRYDEIHKYYSYPKKLFITNIKKLTKHKSSIKEDIFINICKKYIPDLENQVLFTIDNKKYIVDGYSKHHNLVIEFLGDYYHGNPNVYNANYLNDKLNKTFGELHNEWVMRKNIFNNLNYKVIYLWEDDYDKMCKKDIHNWVLSQFN